MPFSLSPSVSTAPATAVGMNILCAGATPTSLSILSMLLTGFWLPMNMLKLPSRVSAETPITSFSLAHTSSSSAENDWATAP